MHVAEAQWLAEDIANYIVTAAKIMVDIGSGNDLSPIRCQAVTWTRTDLTSMEPSGTQLNEIRFEKKIFLFKLMCLQLSFAK